MFEYNLLRRVYSPDWDRFAEVMEGGQEKWDNLVEKKSSREIADLLVEQISSGGKLGASETTLFFDSHVSRLASTQKQLPSSTRTSVDSLVLRNNSLLRLACQSTR